ALDRLEAAVGLLARLEEVGSLVHGGLDFLRGGADLGLGGNGAGDREGRDEEQHKAHGGVLLWRCRRACKRRSAVAVRRGAGPPGTGRVTGAWRARQGNCPPRYRTARPPAPEPASAPLSGLPPGGRLSRPGG